MEQIDIEKALELRAAGNSYDKIAAVLGVSRNAAHWHINKALKDGRKLNAELPPLFALMAETATRTE